MVLTTMKRTGEKGAEVEFCWHTMLKIRKKGLLLRKERRFLTRIDAYENA